jgi:hypothetical protein
VRPAFDPSRSQKEFEALVSTEGGPYKPIRLGTSTTLPRTPSTFVATAGPIFFKLEQITGSAGDLSRRRVDRFGHYRVKEIPVEQALTERMLVEDREPYEAERREQRLVLRLAEKLEREGHEVCRLQFRPDGADRRQTPKPSRITSG